MSSNFKQFVESRKSFLINELISVGVFKKDQSHLFELSLSELEDVYMNMRNKQLEG